MFKNLIVNIFAIFILLVSNGCTTVEDYMLGKDNTPKPEPLAELKPKINLTEKWSMTLNQGLTKGTKLKPFIHDNIIYVAHSNGTVQALKNNGKILWSQALRQPIISGPEVGEGYIALGTANASLIVLSQKDGSLAWQTHVSGDVLAKPAIIENKVLAKTIDGSLYAFNIKNGEKLWADFHGAPHIILQASSNPVIFGKVALVGFSDGSLDAIDLQSGSVLWQKSISYAKGASDVERLVDIDTDPLIEGEIAYIATYQGYVGALSLRTGEFIWKKPASTYKNLAIDNYNVYLTSSDDVIYAYNKRDGHVSWKQAALKARNLTEPVVMNKKLFIGDKQGFLHALNAEDGEIISRTKLSGPIEISPVVEDRNLIILTSNGKINSLSIG